MKVSVEDRQGLFKSLKVEVEGDIVKSALDEVYEYLRQNVEIEGFRRGKVPLWIIKARFKDYIREEVGKRVANATLTEAIQESGLRPVADIYLEEVDLQEKDQRVSYSISFEVPPDFELADLEGLEVEIEKVEFNEDLVKRRIEEIREEHALWEPVEREVKEGDLVIIEYKVEDLEEGETTEGETSAVVGSRMFREEIERELIGKKEGDSFTLEELTLYDMEGKPAGKAKVEIRIKGVKEKVLPELSDEFAKEIGLGETWAEAEEKIKQDIKEQLERLRKSIIENAVAKKLIEMHQFDVPQTLLQRELSHLIQNRASQLAQLGIDVRYLDYRSMAQELAPQAIANIKLRYILDKYAQKENITVEPQEIERKIEELAKTYGKTVEEMKEFLEKEGLMSVLEEDIRREKAFERIISKASIKEKEKEERDENT